MKQKFLCCIAVAGIMAGCSKQSELSKQPDVAKPETPAPAIQATNAIVPPTPKPPAVVEKNETNAAAETNAVAQNLPASIVGTISLNGKPPEPGIIDMSSISDCAKAHVEPVKSKAYVAGANNELKDVVVYLQGALGKSTGEASAPLALDQLGCEYTPFIAAVQTGQKIIVKNSDPVFHNVDIVPTVDGNHAANKAQAPGAPEITMTFSNPENFIHFKCDVHPWMNAYVTVLDNPYFAVSAKDGSYKISNVPPGKYTITAMHRRAGKIVREIEIKGATVTQDFVLSLPK